MKTTVEILTEAKALINTPEKWLREGPHFARTTTGEPCSTSSPDASSFDIFGAWMKAGAGQSDAGKGAYKLLVGAFGMPLMWGNDIFTHAEVMDAFDRAIELAKAAE